MSLWIANERTKILRRCIGSVHWLVVIESARIQRVGLLRGQNLRLLTVAVFSLVRKEDVTSEVALELTL